uniref:GLOBIN domain-containing protein n=1 Tax=Heterorhabditis bacteriophora TaxID=37862 RepID=A0A1I7WDV5_HETBA
MSQPINDVLFNLCKQLSSPIIVTFSCVSGSKLKEIEAKKLFAEYPHYKNIWPQFRAIPDSSLISSDNLKNHAKVYMSGLQCLLYSTLLITQKINCRFALFITIYLTWKSMFQEIVTVLDDNDKLCEVTRRIARSHCKWNIYKYHIEVGELRTFFQLSEILSIPQNFLSKIMSLLNFYISTQRKLKCLIFLKILAVSSTFKSYFIYFQHMVPELIDVLNQCMGGNITPEVAEAWSTLYDIIGNMINILLTYIISFKRWNRIIY